MPGELYQDDNLSVLRDMEAGSVDLIYADPPFGTGQDWDAYVDKRTGEDYLAWIKPRLTKMRRVLAPTGSIYFTATLPQATTSRCSWTTSLGRRSFVTRSFGHIEGGLRQAATYKGCMT